MVRTRPFVLTSAAAAALASLVAGCGGGSSPGVARIASSTTTAARIASGTVAFSQCMRAHGVAAFPSPDSTGGIPKSGVVAARQADPARFDTASNACAYLLPKSGLGSPSQPITLADRTAYLRAAACMRRHGFPDFPDPSFQDGNVRFNLPPSINKNSPLAVRAVTTCRKLIPPGLPYSGTDHP